MVVVRFLIMFDKIRDGSKKQTIRPFHNYQRLEIGNAIHCYSTKKVSYSKRPILDELLYKGKVTEIFVVIWDEIQDNDEIAKLDGFRDSQEMRMWFEQKYGVVPEDKNFRIIRWSD